MTNATRGFARSAAMLAKAIRRHAPGPIPYGLGLVPAIGVPHYFTRASGALLEDVDGNRLIDLDAGSGAVLLGHAAPEVIEAVTRILRDGLVGVPTRLEAAVAERLVALRPWARRVRFAKTGSEAVALAVRLARAHTGRELLAVGGYHGWHDAVAAGIPRQRGIPKALHRLCLGFRAIDPDSLGELLDRHPQTICGRDARTGTPVAASHGRAPCDLRTRPKTWSSRDPRRDHERTAIASSRDARCGHTGPDDPGEDDWKRVPPRCSAGRTRRGRCGRSQPAPGVCCHARHSVAGSQLRRHSTRSRGRTSRGAGAQRHRVAAPAHPFDPALRAYRSTRRRRASGPHDP